MPLGTSLQLLRGPSLLACRRCPTRHPEQGSSARCAPAMAAIKWAPRTGPVHWAPSPTLLGAWVHGPTRGLTCPLGIAGFENTLCTRSSPYPTPPPRTPPRCRLAPRACSSLAQCHSIDPGEPLATCSPLTACVLPACSPGMILATRITSGATGGPLLSMLVAVTERSSQPAP